MFSLTSLWPSSSKTPLSDKQQAAAAAAKTQLAQAPVPVLWMIGKTQTGKSSIVRFLTKATAAEVGNGFQPKTKATNAFAFPSEAEPIIRFFDTRGLGEAHYDPATDISSISPNAHLVLVTTRLIDHAVSEVVNPLKAIRKAAPTRPVILVITCLHEAYPGDQHPQPDPFANPLELAQQPTDLGAHVKRQLEDFQGLYDQVVCIDLTNPTEGFHQPDLGGDRLQQAIIDQLPAAYRHAVMQMTDVMQVLKDDTQRRAIPTILAHSSAAAAAAAVPWPWADMPVVIGLQTRLLYRIAEIYGQTLEVGTLMQLATSIGSQIVRRMALRELCKAIPLVGSAVNAALAFATTYGLGLAACWYFSEIKKGHAPTANQLRDQWLNQMNAAQDIWTRYRQ